MRAAHGASRARVLRHLLRAGGRRDNASLIADRHARRAGPGRGNRAREGCDSRTQLTLVSVDRLDEVLQLAADRGGAGDSPRRLVRSRASMAKLRVASISHALKQRIRDVFAKALLCDTHRQ